MYKLMIVDDEPIEREGMANLIPWKDYDVTLCGTAANGQDACAIARETNPDIILTDIEMPVMDGLELIRRGVEEKWNTVFVVLSGYGDFKYTSQAMLYGIRHYILKPCDEEQIVTVLEEVKLELDRRRREKEQNAEYSKMRSKMLPRALDQLFYNLLLGKEVMRSDHEFFARHVGTDAQVMVLGICRPGSGFDHLQQFAIGNILGELLHIEGRLLSTAVADSAYLLLSPRSTDALEKAMGEALQALNKLNTAWTKSAVSKPVPVRELNTAYRQIQELYSLGELEQADGLLCYERFSRLRDGSDLFFDYRRIAEAKSYEEVLFETYLAFCKMKLRQCSFRQQRKLCDLALFILHKGNKNLPDSVTEQNLLSSFSAMLAEKLPRTQESKEYQRMKNILLAIYERLDNTELNVQFLACDVLYMNEDYLGRIFLREKQQKLTAYLQETRVALAKRLLEYQPDMKIIDLTELIGFAPDGQYFSKAFRKIQGMTPSEYRERLKSKVSF